MRRFSLICLVIMLAGLSITTGTSASKSTKIISVLNAHLAQIDSDYKNALEQADKKYQPIISESQRLAQEAFIQLKNSSKVKVIKLGSNRNYWGQFECSETRPNCIGVDKGPEFQVGEIISFKENSLNDVDQLNVNQLIIKEGLVELLNANSYNMSAESFRKAIGEYSLATSQLAQAKASANRLHADGLMIEDAIRIAKISAKRADKSPASYEKSFLTSYIFETNRDGLRKYASTPFAEINSLKALDEVIEITKLSKQADQVAAQYSSVAAAKLNRICGTTFTQEPEFKANFQKIAKLYKKATKVTLSIKS